METPDDIEKILEEDAENEMGHDNNDAQEVRSSNLVDPGPDMNNVLQFFQNPLVIGYLRGLMTHQAPLQNNTPQISQPKMPQGDNSSQDGIQINSTMQSDSMQQADDTSAAETEYLEDLTQEYKKTEKRGPPMSCGKLQKVTQDLVWGIYKSEKFEQVMGDIHPPENIENLEVTKVNIEVWRKISHSTKSNDIKLQNLQNLFLKGQIINCFLIDSLYKGTRQTDPKVALDIIKTCLKKCADSAMILEN